MLSSVLTPDLLASAVRIATPLALVATVVVPPSVPPPVAMFMSYGGIANQVYAGSVNSALPNSFFALNAVNGAQVSAFDNGGAATPASAIATRGTLPVNVVAVDGLLVIEEP